MLKLTLSLFVACTAALNLYQSDKPEGVKPDAPAPAPEEKTIIGFFFEGFDFGNLWEKMTDEQRNEVKTHVFDMTLEAQGFKPADFKDNTFKFTEDQRSKFLATKKEKTDVKREPGMAEENKDSTNSEKKKEKVLAEVSECAGCKAKRLREERRCGHHIESHCCEEEPHCGCHDHGDCGCHDHQDCHNDCGCHNHRGFEGKRNRRSYVY